MIGFTAATVRNRLEETGLDDAVTDSSVFELNYVWRLKLNHRRGGSQHFSTYENAFIELRFGEHRVRLGQVPVYKSIMDNPQVFSLMDSTAKGVASYLKDRGMDKFKINGFYLKGNCMTPYGVQNIGELYFLEGD